MPNTPVAVGKGVVALVRDSAEQAGRKRAEALMQPLGLVEWADEKMFDVVTAIAGSGPAFLFRFIDALAEAGAERGCPPIRRRASRWRRYRARRLWRPVRTKARARWRIGWRAPAAARGAGWMCWTRMANSTR